MRINKYIAEAGVASRRNADQMIKEGRVSVNGKKISECGIDVNPDNDTVYVDGVKTGLVLDQQIENTGTAWDGWGFTLEESTLKFKNLA